MKLLKVQDFKLLVAPSAVAEQLVPLLPAEVRKQAMERRVDGTPSTRATPSSFEVNGQDVFEMDHSLSHSTNSQRSTGSVFHTTYLSSATQKPYSEIGVPSDRTIVARFW